MSEFDGSTFVPARDGSRLMAQMKRVTEVMDDGEWHTLFDLSAATDDPLQSVSARLRDMRKERFGGHTILRRYVSKGVFEYRKERPSAQ